MSDQQFREVRAGMWARVVLMLQFAVPDLSDFI
jgi:hypothetical protein